MGKPVEIEFAVDLNRPANDPKDILLPANQADSR